MTQAAFYCPAGIKIRDPGLKQHFSCIYFVFQKIPTKHIHIRCQRNLFAVMEIILEFLGVIRKCSHPVLHTSHNRICFISISTVFERLAIGVSRILKPFSSQTGLRFNPGDIIVLYPTALGGGEEVVSYKATKVQETFETVEAGVKSYASRVKYGFAM